ncbi:hypothetical protein HUN01_12580 [Nostoc edaphicum CCNP1411]|uniref:Uncharacterized protein n=1 Tax=Nostoc edaphicum CCNP1411 TaxID=1472755 RepID=A0A7D7LDJ9_9NOSO|nr:hypothetical protein [Nostoc edaphicum]QMS88389.1 hypothetical protein HUN01_12580 [Nostoc edaphicum CCNP1411]
MSLLQQIVAIAPHLWKKAYTYLVYSDRFSSPSLRKIKSEDSVYLTLEELKLGV